MKIQNQCCNEKLALRLKELGVVQESLFYHSHSSKWGVMPKKSMDFKEGNPTSAFNCSELVQMCGNIYAIELNEKTNKFYSGSATYNDIVFYNTFADALASKLINAIEKKWVTIEEVNNRLIS